VFFQLKKVVMWFITTSSAIFIIVFCLANRSSVEIDIWPFPLKQHVPLFSLLLACIGIGVFWGSFASWLSARASRKKNQETKRIAVAATLNARHAEERCSRLEHDLKAQKNLPKIR
jgi:lysylphosphatidylglycerol synthetase-like protein (DUF2156 family)